MCGIMFLPKFLFVCVSRVTLSNYTGSTFTTYLDQLVFCKLYSMLSVSDQSPWFVFCILRAASSTKVNDSEETRTIVSM